MAEAGELRVEYADLGALVRAPRNPKQHDLGALHASLDRFGFVAPILIDDATGRIVAGHGRLDALQQLKASGAAPPDRVRVAGDRWLVPVIRGVAFASPLEAESYLVADNQTTILGGWDEARLAELLADLAAQQALAGTGFDQDAVDELLREVGRTNGMNTMEDPGPQMDRAAELQQEWQTATGQLWTIRSATGTTHRLLCGDCTREQDVARLMDGARPDAVLTDPPYCSGGFQEAGRRSGSVGTDAEHRKITNDTLSTRGYVSLMKNALGLANAGICYVFTDWRMWVNLFDVVESSGFGVRNMIVWDKGTPGMGVGWRAQHELIMFASRDSRGFNNKLAVGNVIQCGRTGNIHHTTEKPVELLRTLLRVADFARIVYDPFAGSGSTILAAEAEGRTALAMEVEPDYAAATLERLKLSGLEPSQLA